jgi:hypothetical protein
LSVNYYTSDTGTTTATTWRNWNETYATTSTTATDVWVTWNETATATPTASITTEAVWGAWVVTTDSRRRGITYRVPAQVLDVTPYVPTPEERAEQKRRDEVAAEAKRIANEKAEALLKEILTPEERDEWTKQRTITVQAASGVKYKLLPATHGNVRVLGRDGLPDATLCVFTTGNVPLADHLVTQVLMLRHDEKELLAKANRTVLRQAG